MGVRLIGDYSFHIAVHKRQRGYVLGINETFVSKTNSNHTVKRFLTNCHSNFPKSTFYSKMKCAFIFVALVACVLAAPAPAKEEKAAETALEKPTEIKPGKLLFCITKCL